MGEPFSFQSYPMNSLPQQRAVRFRGVRGIGVTTIVLIILVVIFSAIGVWGEPQEDAGQPTLTIQDGQTGVALLTLLGYLLCGIFFWIWQARARGNAEVLAGPRTQKLHRGWLFWGWWCPVVALWFPFRALADIDRVSPPRRRALLVGCWWPPMLASMLLFYFVVGSGLGDQPSVGRIHLDAVLLIVALVCECVAALIVIMIIKEINGWQRKYRVPGGSDGDADPFAW